MSSFETNEGESSLSPVEAYRSIVPGIKLVLRRTRDALDKVSDESLMDSGDLFGDPEESSFKNFLEEEDEEGYKPLYDVIVKTHKLLQAIRDRVKKRPSLEISELQEQVQSLNKELEYIAPGILRMDQDLKKDQAGFQLIPENDDVEWSPEQEERKLLAHMSEEMQGIFEGLRDVLERTSAFIDQHLKEI